MILMRKRKSRKMADAIANKYNGKVHNSALSFGIFSTFRYCVKFKYRNMRIKLYVCYPYLEAWVQNFRLEKNNIACGINVSRYNMYLDVLMDGLFLDYDIPVYSAEAYDMEAIRKFCSEAENESDIKALDLGKSEYLWICSVQIILLIKAADLKAFENRLNILARFFERNTIAKRNDKIRPLLKQFSDLRPPDFIQHSVWVNCHGTDSDEAWYENTDEETFRPWEGDLPVDPGVAMFLVKAIFTLADGTKHDGFVTPQHQSDEPNLGIMVPCMFAGSGMLLFWFGIMKPSPEYINGFYARIGKTAEQVFPVRFKAEDALTGGTASGTIPGFCRIGKHDEVIVFK